MTKLESFSISVYREICITKKLPKTSSVKSSTCLHQPRGLEIDKVNRVPITALKLCQKESSVIAGFIEEVQSVASAQNELD